MFAEIFITPNADALVTGNLRHYKPLLEQNTVILSPAQFLEKYFPEKEDIRNDLQHQGLLLIK